MLEAIFSSEYFLISLKILLATLFGAAIGYDREKYGKPAGIKTHAMVCLGSCIVMVIGSLTASSTGYADPNRLAAQVVSGVGFLCGGVIIVTIKNEIRGLTTAAGLWLAACMGLCIGSSFTWVCVPAGLCYYFITHILARLERSSFKNLQEKKKQKKTTVIEDDEEIMS
ncbi:MAG: MgtC/SapB family protein [Erysipelotrichaceae bacterium]|nr:MgtC/SapB family protein [Erysipelotrichaceae bacterium]